MTNSHFAAHARGSGTSRCASLRRERYSLNERVGHTRLRIEDILKRSGQGVYRTLNLWVVQTIFRLSLELELTHRARNAYREDRYQSLSNILACKLYPLSEVVYRDVVSERLGQTTLKSILVGTAALGVNTVNV